MSGCECEPDRAQPLRNGETKESQLAGSAFLARSWLTEATRFRYRTATGHGQPAGAFRTVLCL